MYDDEISPEELFNRFFGGGGGGGFGGGPFGGGLFDGPQFVFNLGGGPGIRVHQFGGNGPRRRPREANRSDDRSPPSGMSALTQLLPLLLLFILPLLSSLFSSSTPAGPGMRFDSPIPPYTLHRTTPKLKVNYFVNPREVEDYSSRKFTQLDSRAEVDYVSKLRFECQNEVNVQERMLQDAQGWFFPDEEKIKAARSMELRSCRKLNDLHSRGY